MTTNKKIQSGLQQAKGNVSGLKVRTGKSTPTFRRAIAIGFITVLAAGATGGAQQLSSAGASRSARDSRATLPAIVLVHGAWADASSWSGVIERLQKAGYQVTGVQLGLGTLDDDVARTRGVLAAQTGPTLLVAHSYGGAVITQLGSNAPNVVGLVYESAFAPDEGETMKALINGGPQPAGAAAIRPDKQGYLWLEPAGFLKFFAPDVNPAQARVMEAVQKPISAAAFFGEEKFGPPAWKSFPSWFLITEDDQMVPPAAQHLFAKRMNATVASLAGSHVSMVSHPDVVASFIIKAARSVQAK